MQILPRQGLVGTPDEDFENFSLSFRSMLNNDGSSSLNEIKHFSLATNIIETRSRAF